MPWQELIGHINSSRVRVRSRMGTEYAVETENRRLNDDIYTQLVNDAHDDVDFWAFVEFPDGDCPSDLDADGPVVIDYSRGDRPEKAPWEYP